MAVAVILLFAAVAVAATSAAAAAVAVAAAVAKRKHLPISFYLKQLVPIESTEAMNQQFYLGSERLKQKIRFAPSYGPPYLFGMVQSV